MSVPASAISWAAWNSSALNSHRLRLGDESVVVYGSLVSSRHPGDLGPWMKALIAALS